MPSFIYIPSAGSSFTPTDLSSLQAWYKADSISQSDNTDVTTWSDSSGNGYDLTGYGTTKPKFRTSVQNSLPVIRFNASGYLSRNAWSGFPSNNSAKAVAAVIEVVSTTTAKLYVTSGPTGSKRQDLVRIANATPRYLLRDAGGSFEFCDGGSSVAAGYRIYLAGNDSSTVPFIRLDGTAETLTFGGSYSDLNMTDSTSATFNVGGFSDASSLLGQDEEVCEVVFCNASLSTSDREKVEGYLAHKWGLTANLPSGHTYKNSAP